MTEGTFQMTAGAAPRPFLKWVGGKRQLLPELVRRLPPAWGRYHEPFVGGGALFFHLQPAAATLSDINSELVNAYLAVRDYTGSLIDHLEGLHRAYGDLPPEGRSALYYRMRDDFNGGEESPTRRAVLTIFLNRTGFNGLYRVNKRGGFNVPWGKYVNPAICDADNLRACARALRRADVLTTSFETTMAGADPGDLVYCDPPYVPVSETANFTSYSRRRFGMVNQEALARAVENATSRGVHVMLSNADVPWVRERYAAFYVHPVQARRAVNCKGARRGPVGEVIVTNYEPGAGAPAEEVRSDEG